MFLRGAGITLAPTLDNDPRATRWKTAATPKSRFAGSSFRTGRARMVGAEASGPVSRNRSRKPC
jgi:hypothetical protein